MKKEKNLLIGIILGICGILFIMMLPCAYFCKATYLKFIN